MGSDLFASHKQLAFPDNAVMVNPVSEDRFTPAIPKLVELAKVTGGRVKDLVMAPFESAVKIGEAINDSSKRQKYFENPAELTNDMLNIAAPSSIGNKSYGLGAINLEGFFSPLTRAFEERKIGKSLLSPKMSGNQMLATLKSGGIKDDELKFTGVGKILGTDIGEKQVGKKVVGLKNVAEKKSLEFSREDRPGDYHTYSLFPDGDETFKTALYKLPNTGFNESHFGKDVVAHRRFGSKDLFDVPLQKEKEAAGTGINWKAALANDERYKNRKSTLHLDEVQSQFYEKGSKFGYGNPKVKDLSSEFNTARDYATSNKFGINQDVIEYLKPTIDKLDQKVVFDATRFVDLESELRGITEINTPQDFGKLLKLSGEQDDIYRRYSGSVPKPVADAPLQGEKYVELLAKDHLRDALKEGKDAVSWTPSNVQHERYYGKDALGGFKWKFDNDAEFGTTKINVYNSDGKLVKAVTDIDDLKKSVGNAGANNVVEKLMGGVEEGLIEGNAKDVYKKLYDRAIPKAFEKLTGEKPRTGFVKDRDGRNVEIQYIPIDKFKEKNTIPAKEKEFYAGEIDDYIKTAPINKREYQEYNNLEKEYRDRFKDNYDEYYDNLNAGDTDKVKSIINKNIVNNTVDWRGIVNTMNSGATELSEQERRILRDYSLIHKHKEKGNEYKTKVDRDTERLKQLTPQIKELPITSREDTAAMEFFV